VPLSADGICTPITVSDEQWDLAVQEHPTAHFLQSATWGDFKTRYGWQVQRVSLGDGDVLASVLSRPMLGGALRLGYVPRGPVMSDATPAAFGHALAALESLARQSHYLALKVEPELWDTDVPWARAVLTERGWRPGSQVQFRNTVSLPIDGSEETLLAGMKPKTRYNVRLAERRGVNVHPASDADLDAVYDLYRQTAIRDGFIVRPRSYYRELWGSLRGAGMAEVLVAEHEGRLLGGLVVVAYGRTAWYLHGASSDDGRNLMPTYLLQWRAIQWARARGCTTYDMWGAPDSEDESDPMYGVLRFKLGFGGVFRQGIGAWDYAPHRLPYFAYSVVLPRLLSLTRAARRRTQQRE